MDTDTHGMRSAGFSALDREKMEQSCMVMFWRNAILGYKAECSQVKVVPIAALCRPVRRFIAFLALERFFPGRHTGALPDPGERGSGGHLVFSRAALDF